MSALAEAVQTFAAWWVADVLPWAVESTAAAALLLAVLRLARRRSPAFRLAAASLGLAKLALPPLLLPVGALSFGVADGAGGSAPLGAPLAAPGWLPWVAPLALLHAAGVLLTAALLGRRLHRLAALRRRAVRLAAGPLAALHAATARRLGLRRTPALLVSRDTEVPFATGLLRPAVVLPARLAALPPDRLRPLLAHELAHLAGLDLPLAWLRAAAQLLWWPNPLARALAVRQEAAMEERCDDRVVDGGFAPPRLYAHSLLAAAAVAVAGRRPLPFAAASGGHLERRLRRLATARAEPRRRLAAAALLVALALLLLPTAASGAASPAGWTTRLLFLHPDHAGSGDPSPAGSHQHRHRHAH